MKKILVTGANGFIGKPLCRTLTNTGWKVRGAVRRRDASIEGVETVVIDRIGPSTDWHEALRDVDYVVHLAAKVHSMEQENLEAYFSINAEGTAQLAEAAAACGVKRFILASSVKAMTESTAPDSPLTERMSPTPQDAYGKSKLEAERRLAKICATTGMEWLILRLPLVYGPEVKANMLRLIGLVDKNVPLPFRNITNRRSLISLENLIDIFVSGLTHPDAGNETFLVSDGQALSTPELITMIAHAMGRSPRLFPVPVSILKFLGHLADGISSVTRRDLPLSAASINRLAGSLEIDSGHLCKTMEWHPKFTTEQGIKKMVEWYQKRT